MVYEYDNLNDRQHEILAIAHAVKDAEPEAWASAHRAPNPLGSEFVRRVALELRRRGWNAGVNGKRGNVHDLSMDPVTFPVRSGGVADGSGTYAQIAIIDLIASAGGDGAHLAWIDVTEETRAKGDIGAFVLPEVFGETPAPPAPAPVPPSTPAVPTCPTCEVVKAQLAALHEQQQLLLQGVSQLPSREDLQAVQDALWGLVSDKVIAEQFGALREAVAGIAVPAATRCNFPLKLRGAAAVVHALQDMQPEGADV